MAKISLRDKHTGHAVVQAKTTKTSSGKAQTYNWWRANSKKDLSEQLLATAMFLKEQQSARVRHASIHARLYGNLPISNVLGVSLINTTRTAQLPVDRPTMNVVQSCTDTLVSRIGQSRPKPTFLTDGGDYKQRKLAKQLNNFIAGEFYQTEAYRLAEDILRDSAILGDGFIHIFEDADSRVAIERVLATELMVDSNDGFHGTPRCLYRTKIIDRDVLAELFPTEKGKVDRAEQAYVDSSQESQRTASDQVIVVEAWHLPSSKDATDGRHCIVCTSGLLLDETYEKEDFPFVKMGYSPRLVGYWAQGLAEQLTGTQVEINKLLQTISKSISIVGVPRVFVEDGSKVVKTHLNDQIGSIITYRGTKPLYEVAPSVHPELYQQLQRLIDYSYQQSGVSALSAASTKPAGLNSGAAIRNYDDLQSDRFASLNKRYNRMFEDLAYKMIELAKDIAERTGKYMTVYPGKNGTMKIDLPAAKQLDDPFVIQCFDSSALPKDPAGRLQTITEMMQAGVLDPAEGRRLLDYPDLEQVDKLASAAEERILKTLDDIVEKGESGYEPPDPYTDLTLATKLVAQYYNLYVAGGLEESKAELLRNWHSQLQLLQQAAMPQQPAMPGAPAMAGDPQAVPQAPPTSDILPQ